MNCLKFATFLAACWVTSAFSTGAEPIDLSLWPDAEGDQFNVPGATGQSPADRPRLIVHLANSDTPAPVVVVLPGGGYGGLASGHEGTEIAAWLNDQGITAAICLYRHRNTAAGYGYPIPLVDAQRAVQWVRSQASTWNLDPKRVGVIGFSAGGHLATSLCTTALIPTEIDDAAAKLDCLPNFAIVCYPVIAFGRPYTHLGSQRNLLGDQVSADRLEELSTDRRVTEQTPPTFLWHTAEDQAVRATNSLVYYQALLDHGVPAELHIFPKGRHGLGLAVDAEGAEQWPALCVDWMRRQGFLNR
jgi:acetyl esterase/lipase